MHLCVYPLATFEFLTEVFVLYTSENKSLKDSPEHVSKNKRMWSSDATYFDKFKTFSLSRYILALACLQDCDMTDNGNFIFSPFPLLLGEKRKTIKCSRVSYYCFSANVIEICENKNKSWIVSVFIIATFYFASLFLYIERQPSVYVAQ